MGVCKLMRRSIYLGLITLVAALFSVAVLAAPGAKGAHPKSQVSYEVGFTIFVINDAARPTEGFPDGRPTAVYIWYPADAASIEEGVTSQAWYPMDPFSGTPGAFPSAFFESEGFHKAYQEPDAAAGPFKLVMFSPGWGAPGYAYVNIGPSLASQGFVFAAVTHYGDGATINNPAEPIDELGWALYNRPRDVSAALDALLGRNVDAGNLLHGTMDPATITASGHSLGGYAAMVLAGGDDEVCDLADDPGDTRPTPPQTCAPSYPDPRIKSIIPLDGSNQMLWFYELARIDVPVMSMGQEWSALEAGGFADWQARQHAAFSGHPSYRVDVNNADHMSFAIACAFFGYPCALDSETHRLVNKYMLAFLTKQQNILTPGHAINSEPDIEFFVTEKRNTRAIETKPGGMQGEDHPDHFVYFKHQSGKATAKAEKDSTNQPPVAYFDEQP